MLAMCVLGEIHRARAQSSFDSSSPIARAADFLSANVNQAVQAQGWPATGKDWIDVYLADRSLLMAQQAGVPIEIAPLRPSADALQRLPSDTNAAVAAKIISLRLTQQSSGQLRSELLSSQNTDGGWGLAPGKQSNPIDTAIALDALLNPAGLQTDPGVALRAVQFLVAKQNSLGVWLSTNESDASDFVRAARCLLALSQARPLLDDPVATMETAQFHAKTYVEGGLGSPVPTRDLASMLVALWKIGEASNQNVATRVGSLLGSQRPDGGWSLPGGTQSDMASTAAMLELLLAVAPVRRPQPDLALATDSVTASVDPGGTGLVTLNIDVYNVGTDWSYVPDNGAQARVRLFDLSDNSEIFPEGGPANAILPAMQPRSHLFTPIGFAIQCDAQVGHRHVRVVIDPWSVSDSDLRNNVMDFDVDCASGALTRLARQGEEVSLDPASPVVSNTNLDLEPVVQLSALVHNDADHDSSSFDVEFWMVDCGALCPQNACACSGQPQPSGQMLGVHHIDKIAAHSAQVASVLWRPPPPASNYTDTCVIARIPPHGSSQSYGCVPRKFRFSASQVQLTLQPTIPDESSYYARTLHGDTPLDGLFHIGLTTGAPTSSPLGGRIEFEHYMWLSLANSNGPPLMTLTPRVVGGTVGGTASTVTLTDDLFAHRLTPGAYTITGNIVRVWYPPPDPTRDPDDQPLPQETGLPPVTKLVHVGKSREIQAVSLYFIPGAGGQRMCRVSVGTRGNVLFHVDLRVTCVQDGHPTATIQGFPWSGSLLVQPSSGTSGYIDVSAALPSNPNTGPGPAPSYTLYAYAIVHETDEPDGILPVPAAPSDPPNELRSNAAHFVVQTTGDYSIIKYVSSPLGAPLNELPVRDGEPLHIEIDIRKNP
jgi:hypothetical protein